MLGKVKGFFLDPRYCLALIVGVAAVVRLWGLGSAEFFHDEGLYAFRSVGYIDFIENPDQTTPVQWFKDAPLPWWTHLSFHDHPPLFFLAQHLSFSILGNSIFAARLPSALAGIASVAVFYLIFEFIFKKKTAGLLAALLLAVNYLHIWISRSSLLESLMLLFVFLNFYCFLRALEDAKWWKYAGISLGLALLAKYTAIFVVPAYAVYAVAYKRKIFRQPQLYAGAVLAGLLCVPIFIYNAYLYRATGHFDLQFAYIFRQATPEWRASFGKFLDPFSDIYFNLSLMYSAFFLIATGAGIVAGWQYWRKEKKPLYVFSAALLASVTLVLYAVGSGYRFLALYLLPAFLFLIALREWLMEKYGQHMLVKCAIALFVAYEAFFAIDGTFFTFPNFGIVQLDAYLNRLFQGRRSPLTFESPNPHLKAVMEEYGNRRPPAAKPFLVIFDENVAISTRLWVFARRLYFEGVPVITAGNFKRFLQSQGVETFKGYEIFFVKASPYTSLNTAFATGDANELETFLRQEFDLKPEKVIYGYDQARNPQPMFSIYKITL